MAQTVSGVLGQLADQALSEYGSAKQANIDRYVEAKNLYEKNLQMYQPGGQFGAGYEAQLQSAKKEDVGKATQHAISTGMYGVESTGALGQRWERQVGSQARLQLEDMRTGKLAGARQDLAGVIERRQDEYPDFRLIADLYQQAASAGAGSGGMSVRVPEPKSAANMYMDAMNRTGGVRGGSSGGSSSSDPGTSYSQSSRGVSPGSTSTGGFVDPASSTPTTPATQTAPTQIGYTYDGFKAWWSGLSSAEKKARHLTGSMGPGGYLSFAGKAAYKTDLQDVGQYTPTGHEGTAYGDYLTKMEDQPGAVVATQDEYSQIVARLNQQYGSPTGIVGR